MGKIYTLLVLLISIFWGSQTLACTHRTSNTTDSPSQIAYEALGGGVVLCVDSDDFTNTEVLNIARAGARLNVIAYRTTFSASELERFARTTRTTIVIGNLSYSMGQLRRFVRAGAKVSTRSSLSEETGLSGSRLLNLAQYASGQSGRLVLVVDDNRFGFPRLKRVAAAGTQLSVFAEQASFTPSQVRRLGEAGFVIFVLGDQQFHAIHLQGFVQSGVWVRMKTSQNTHSAGALKRIAAAGEGGRGRLVLVVDDTSLSFSQLGSIQDAGATLVFPN